MSTDQAARLRHLALMVRGPAVPRPTPRLLLVASGQGGAGTTSVAVLLAAALTADGQRTLLVEAAEHSAAAAMCGLDGGLDLDDVLSRRHSPTEAIAQTSTGLYLLAHPWNHPKTPSRADDARRWTHILPQLAHTVDWVVIDSGHGFTPLLSTFWPQAEQIAIVCTHDALARMACYRLLKSAAAARLVGVARQGERATSLGASAAGNGSGADAARGAACRAEAYLLVNQASQPAAAWGACQRLRWAARRFLGMALACGGTLPWDARLHQAATQGRLHDPAAVPQDTRQMLRRLVRQLCGLSQDIALPRCANPADCPEPRSAGVQMGLYGHGAAAATACGNA